MHRVGWTGTDARSSLPDPRRTDEEPTGTPPPEEVAADPRFHPTVEALRAAGCVFAEDEAAILIEESETSGAPFKDLVARRIVGEPLEQIVGWVEFAGLRLNVRPGAFIPRQRTLLLAELSVLSMRDRLCASGVGKSAPIFLEAFCGIGPVASVVSDSVHGAEVHFGDKDSRALEIAAQNTQGTAHFLDCLHGLPSILRHKIDVIAAVPPYVPVGAAKFLPHEAVDYEPRTALFGGADGLDLVRRLIAEAPEVLRPEGTMLIELGHMQVIEIGEQANLWGWSTQTHLGEDEQTAVLSLSRSC